MPFKCTNVVLKSFTSFSHFELLLYVTNKNMFISTDSLLFFPEIGIGHIYGYNHTHIHKSLPNILYKRSTMTWYITVVTYYTLYTIPRICSIIHTIESQTAHSHFGFALKSPIQPVLNVVTTAKLYFLQK